MIEMEKHLPGKHDQKTHGRRRGGRLYQEVVRRGGFTYQPVTGKCPSEGYGLSPFPEHEEVIPYEEFTRDHLEAYRKKHWDKFQKDSSLYMGGWHDVEKGKIYLDISIVVDDIETAYALAKKYNQEGFYDFKARRTIIVKPPEERRKAGWWEGVVASHPISFHGGNDGGGMGGFQRPIHDSDRQAGAGAQAIDSRGVGPPAPDSSITKISSSQVNNPAAFVLGGGGGMPNRLVDIQVEEISGVDKAANRRRFLLMKREGGEEGDMDKADKPMKTEDGKQYPAEAYLYMPDPEKPSTWKLRIWEDIGKWQLSLGAAARRHRGSGLRPKREEKAADRLPSALPPSQNVSTSRFVN